VPEDQAAGGDRRHIPGRKERDGFAAIVDLRESLRQQSTNRQAAFSAGLKPRPSKQQMTPRPPEGGGYEGNGRARRRDRQQSARPARQRSARRAWVCTMEHLYSGFGNIMIGMRKNTVKKTSNRAILAHVKREMATPRMTRSARDQVAILAAAKKSRQKQLPRAIAAD
jgi:hypothetical protein